MAKLLSKNILKKIIIDKTVFEMRNLPLEKVQLFNCYLIFSYQLT